MNDLIDLFRILTEKEIRQLRRSFNNLEADVQVRRLGEFLLEIISNKKKIVTNEYIHKKAILKFGKKFIKNQGKKLFNFTEKFVFTNWLEGEANKMTELKVKKELLLLDYYKSKQSQTDELASNGIANLIQKKSKAINKLLIANQTDYLLHNFQLYTIKNFEYFRAEHSFNKDGAERLENTINYLDAFYTTAKLKYLCEYYIYETKLNLNSNKLYADMLIENSYKIQSLLQLTASKNILLKIYTLIFVATQRLTLENLEKAGKVILDNADKLNDVELSHIITLMINLVTFLKRKENIDSSELTFKLFKHGLNRKIFLIDGKINPVILLNYLFLSIEIKNKRGLKIVEDYYGNIKPTLSEAIKNLKSAINYFIGGKYKKALETCSRGRNQYLLFRIYQKLFIIMCHYELKDFVLVESSRKDLLRDAGKHKEELGKGFHKALKNFCTIIKDIIKVNVNSEKLKFSVENERYITMKKWLLLKIKA